MQTVAKFQFKLSTPSEDDFFSVAGIIEEWWQAKLEKNEEGHYHIRKSSAPATLSHEIRSTDESTMFSLELSEPVTGGTLTTSVRIMKDIDSIVFLAKIDALSTGGIGNIRLDISAPRFILQILEARPWVVYGGIERVFSKPFDVGVDEIDTLIGLLEHPERRLPLIVVSSLNGTIFGNLHVQLARQLCGLCHICVISDEATWLLSERWGREWSCYNGAVRIYWPFHSKRRDPFGHRLFTLDYMMRQGDTESMAAQKMGRLLKSTVLEASAYVADIPLIATFERRYQEIRYYSAISAARSAGEESKLMSLFEEENDRLSKENSALSEKIGHLEREIENLKQNITAISLNTRLMPENDGADRNYEPRTVIEALEIARDEYGPSLGFAIDLFDSARDLDEKAGPPEKILRYLQSLQRLSRCIEQGTVGKSIPDWLRDNNVDASIESETTRNNTEATRARTFKFEDGDFYCEYHAKPTNATSPDKCVRIYFAKTTERPFIRIGYVGRHL